MATTLRGGAQTLDPRLDLLWDKDPRNRDHPVMAVAPEAWEKIDRQHPASPVTDQGKEGACVGHGWAGWCASHAGLDLALPELDAYALAAYHEIQHLDQWTGCAQGPACTIAPSPETYGGTSVKSGGDLMASRGLVASYTWAFGIDELLKALTTVGSAVLGIPWHDGMYEAPAGVLTVHGSQVGAHCIKADAVYWSRETVGLQNSWGPDWGVNGRAEISFAALDGLLRNQGEACVPLPARSAA